MVSRRDSLTSPRDIKWWDLHEFTVLVPSGWHDVLSHNPN
jgi:hypothetical protein